MSYLSPKQSKNNWEFYLLNAYDFRVLYVPSSKELESIIQLRSIKDVPTVEKLSSDEIERQYSILRKTDIQVDIAKLIKSEPDAASLLKVSLAV